VAAFDSLYWRYRDRVLRIAHRFTPSAEDALDVLQETFVYLYRKFPGLVLTARLTTFLYPVVKNLALAARRAAVRARADHDVLDELADRALQGGSDEELAEALAFVPLPHREVLLMRFVDDMSLAEISQALSIPLGTVKSRLHNAIAALREHPRTRALFGR